MSGKKVWKVSLSHEIADSLVSFPFGAVVLSKSVDVFPYMF